MLNDDVSSASMERDSASVMAADGQTFTSAPPGNTAEAKSVAVLFATETGTSEDLANSLFAVLKARDITAHVGDLATIQADALADVDLALFIVSTTGEGDAPYTAEPFFQEIAKGKANEFAHLRYAVLALGDSSYSEFCGAGRRLDEGLASLGAVSLARRVDCDIDYEGPAGKWCSEMVSLLSSAPDAETVSGDFADIGHDRNVRFDTVIKSNQLLVGPGSTKSTRHIEISVDPQAVQYEVGDAIGLIVQNDPAVVADVLNAGQLDGAKAVLVQGAVFPLEEALRDHCEITTVTPRFLSGWEKLCKARALAHLVADDVAHAVFFRSHHVVDVIKRYPAADGLDPQAFVDILRPLQPRLYSIASSPGAVSGEVHLTVAPVKYQLWDTPRFGVATGQLSERAEVGTRITAFIQPNPHFRLPASSVPIIMIGAGTGVAPFRAFLQERAKQDGRGPSWLVFGERNRSSDFLYQTEFEAFCQAGVLTHLDAVFSRDGAEKVYVQHRLAEHASRLAQWLSDGACIYVCGDAAHMAPDVHDALLQAIRTEMKLSEEGAQAYLTTIQMEGRYQRDVY